MRPYERLKSSDFTHHKKSKSDTSEYDRVLNAPKKLDTSYNPSMPIMHDPVIKVKYKVNGKTRVVMIVMEHEDYEMHWACNTSIYTDAREPETLKESITSSNGHLWKMSEISEVKTFLSRKAWIRIKKIILKAKVRKPVPVKLVFNSKEESDRLIHLKSRNLVKGYMQVPVVDYTVGLSKLARAVDCWELSRCFVKGVFCLLSTAGLCHSVGQSVWV